MDDMLNDRSCAGGKIDILFLFPFGLSKQHFLVAKGFCGSYHHIINVYQLTWNAFISTYSEAHIEQCILYFK